MDMGDKALAWEEIALGWTPKVPPGVTGHRNPRLFRKIKAEVRWQADSLIDEATN